MYHDPLIPPISEFVISEEENNAIVYALTLKDSWRLEQNAMDAVRDTLKSLRLRIRDFHLERQKYLCCYCRTNLFGGGAFMIDREHIVPKSHCKALTYVITNLSVACKRCNMEIKKDKKNLFVHIESIEQNHLDLNFYRIIHPNFEVYEDFIMRMQVQAGTTQLVKFKKVKECEKTDYMFDFFKLRELEVHSFDDVQGLPTISQKQTFLLSALGYEINNETELALRILNLLTHDSSGKSDSQISTEVKSIENLSEDEFSKEMDKLRAALKLIPESTGNLGKMTMLGLPQLGHKGGDED